MDFIALCEMIKERAEDISAAVLDRWVVISGAEQWLSLPDGLDYDHLPQLIRQLAAASLCTEYDRTLCEHVVQTAVLHGVHRADQGFGENLIHREYHLMRRALAREMTAEHGETADTYYANMRIDALISVAASAALRGVHQPDELDDGDRRREVASEILDAWPIPGT